MKSKIHLITIPLATFILYYLAGYIPYLLLAPKFGVPNYGLPIALGAAGYAFHNELFLYTNRES